MLTKEILKTYSTENILEYISCIRSLNIGLEENIILCMRELLYRNTDLTLYDQINKKISNLFSNIKKGYVIISDRREEIIELLNTKNIQYIILENNQYYIDQDLDHELISSKKQINDYLRNFERSEEISNRRK